MLPNPQPYFAHLPDPRRETKNKLHKLQDIVMIVLCAVLSGIEDWVGMETFAEEREEWFRGFLELPNGIPSHDTLSDVTGRLNPAAFRQAFLEWVEAVLPSLSGQHVAIDGKTLRGSRGKDGAVHLLSAFATQMRWVLGQCPVEGKSNEITAIPKLLEMLDLEGATVTVDAIGCQKAIADQIIEQGADYVLGLKDNHPQLHEDVRLWLDTQAGRLSPLEKIEKEHGGVGKRRYFLCSFDDLDHFAGVVRAHWSIENSQHWVLDVQFGEDRNRTRTDHAPENLALIRRTALNLVRQNGTPKESLKCRRLRASLNDDYRWQLLAGQQT